MLNPGIRAHDLGKQPVMKLADAVARYGVRHIQLALGKAVPEFGEDRGRLSPGAGHYIRDGFASRGITISVLGCYINPVHPDPDERENALSRFKEHLLYARSFGCSVVGTETGSPLPDCRYSDRIYREDCFQDFLNSLRILVDTAEKTGTIVGIEGVADKHCIHSHERMKRTLEAIPSPNLGIIYDPVNFLPVNRISESNALMEEAFRMFAPRIVAIHAKDYSVKDNGHIDKTLPAGRGELDYPLLMDLIRHYKPWCPVLLENNSPATLPDCLDFIKKIEKERP